jgi:hypothetical protein
MKNPRPRFSRSESPSSQPESTSEWEEWYVTEYSNGAIEVENAYIIGYREWFVEEDESKEPGAYMLMPTGQGEHFWTPGVNEASCIYHRHPPMKLSDQQALRRFQPVDLRETKHTAPEQDCTCGLYHRYSLEEALEYGLNGQRVMGVCITWGKVMYHALAFRTQYSMILGIQDFGLEAEAVTKQYHCELAHDWKHLQEIGLSRGVELPEKFRPKPDLWEKAHRSATAFLMSQAMKSQYVQPMRHHINQHAQFLNITTALRKPGVNCAPQVHQGRSTGWQCPYCWWRCP